MKIRINYVVSNEIEIDEETYKLIQSNNEETIENVKRSAVMHLIKNKDDYYIEDVSNMWFPLYNSETKRNNAER